MKRWRLLLMSVFIIVLVGCQTVNPGDGSISISGLPANTILDYLVVNIGISTFGGKVFCAYEPLNAQQETNRKIYLWVLCQEYYVEEGALIAGTGISVPVALLYQEQNGTYKIVDYRVPRDGIYYGPDVREVFPPSSWFQIMPRNKNEIDSYNNRVRELEQETEREAKSYYGK
jgi:hypothetical protein